MRVCVIGTYLHSNLESFLAEAFENLDHSVQRLDVFEEISAFYSSKYSNYFYALPRIQHIYRKRFIKHVNRKIRSFIEESKPNFIIVHNDAFLHPDTIRAIVDRYKIPFTTYLADDPTFGNRHNYLMVDLQQFTHIFCSESNFLKKLKPLTESPLYFVPGGTSITTYHPIGSENINNEKYSTNLGYVSTSYNACPDGLYRGQILQHIADYGLRIFGDPGWKKIAKFYPKLEDCIVPDGYLPAQEMNLFFNSIKIMLGIVHPQIQTGVAQRIFDCAAAGCFQIAEYKSDIEKLFPNNEIETFETIGELREKVAHYLDHPEKREEKAKKALQTVLENHTWTQRAKQILDIVYKE